MSHRTCIICVSSYSRSYRGEADIFVVRCKYLPCYKHAGLLALIFGMILIWCFGRTVYFISVLNKIDLKCVSGSQLRTAEQSPECCVFVQCSSWLLLFLFYVLVTYHVAD